ncbi:MAG: FliI/YscN family ATPase [Clostridia bacterium]|nr:FliI/YscN family ATPase [Clostridia bacterium]
MAVPDWAAVRDPVAGLSLRVGRAVARLTPVGRAGRVEEAVGLVIAARGPDARVGELCRITPSGSAAAKPDAPAPEGGRPDAAVGAQDDEILAEVVGFRGGRTLLMPLGPISGIAPGMRVEALDRELTVRLGRGMLGRVVGALGEPIDGGPSWPVEEERPLSGEPPRALERPAICERLSVGVRALDHLLTCGRGQRLGIFAGSGVGKSTLLGMIARNTEAPVAVLALVGERGREVREFLDHELGERGREKAVAVVATSDQPPLLRVKAAETATAIAEFFRDRGQDVVLLMDSLTRYALALREVGLAAGEPPTTRGYTPGVFAALPRLLERAGTAARGSITGFYTVLVEGDDLNEPISDAVRGLLDGHVVLSRRLASENHFPAIDVLESVSRLMPKVADPETQRLAAEARRLLAVYRDAADLIQVGAYRVGTDPDVDRAIAVRPRLLEFLRQEPREPSGPRTLADVLSGAAAPEPRGGEAR